MERTARSLPIPVLNTTLGPQIEWGARSVSIEIFPLSNSEDETHIPNQAMFSLQKVLLPAYFLPTSCLLPAYFLPTSCSESSCITSMTSGD